MMISLKTGEWTTDYSGTEFRIITLDRCLHCQTAEAHAAEERTGEIKCLVCCKAIEIETPARIEITVWAEEKAHNTTCTKCKWSGQTGRGCGEDAKFFSRKKDHENRKETPFVSVYHPNGVASVTRTRACWTEDEARAYISINGGTGNVIDQTDRFHFSGF